MGSILPWALTRLIPRSRSVANLIKWPGEGGPPDHCSSLGATICALLPLALRSARKLPHQGLLVFSRRPLSGATPCQAVRGSQGLPLMTRTAAELMLERETRVAYGTVLHSLSEEPLPESSWQLCEDQFLLRGEGDHYFHYERGHGVRIERGAGAAVTEESLWLNGSVYAAIASINGLFPIHASAVACDGKVFAFTAPAGGGKSTIVAALGAHGLPMFCDDTLVLDLSD